MILRMIIIFGAISIVLSNSDDLCPSECICVDGQELEITCEFRNTHITMNLMPKGEYIKLDCDGSTPRCDELPNLPSSYVTFVTQLQVTACPMDGAPLACLLQKIGLRADRLDMLKLRRPGKPLSAEYVAGLHNLTRLDIYDAQDEEVPHTALRTLPALRRFTLHGAHLRLQQGAFENAPPLERLELAMDNIVEIPPGTFKGLTSLHLLGLWRNDITEVTAGAFDGLDSLEELELSDNALKTIPPNAFEAMKRLHTLNLIGNPLAELPSTALSGHKSLKKVNIVDCQMPLEVRGAALAKLPALESLKLSRCKLSTLDTDAFKESRALRDLSLTDNNLCDLPETLFRDQIELEELNLNINQIKTLPPKLFTNLKKLKSLNLNDNLIEELPRLVFSGLSELKSLSVSRNHLMHIATNTFSGAHSLQTLALADNMLTDNFNNSTLNESHYTEIDLQSPLYKLLKLQTLDLSGNQLSVIFYDWRYILLELRTLNLSRNSYTVLYDSDINFISNRLNVDLRYNNISTINLRSSPLLSDQEPPPDTIGEILIDYNPFMCDCQLHGLVLRLQGNEGTTTEPRLNVGNAYCVGPAALHGRSLREVPPAQLQCEIEPSECPTDCSCTFRPASDALELDCNELPDNFSRSRLEDKHTELRLRVSPPSLAALPSHVFSLNLANIGLSEPPIDAPSTLATLDLSNNSITRVPPELLAAQSSLSLLIAGNPLLCDCRHSTDVALLQSSESRITDFPNVTCGDGSRIGRVDPAQLCLNLWLLALTALTTLALAAIATYWRYRREIRLILWTCGLCPRLKFDDHNEGERYDAFISFSHLDERFVVEELVPTLESGPHALRLCVHYRDWVVGELIPTQIERSVEASRHTVVVLSRNFLRSEWGRLEFRAAHVRALRERRPRVLVVTLDDVAQRPELAADLGADLRAYLATNTYLPRDDPRFYRKLRYALRRRLRFALPHRGNTHGALDVRLTPDGKLINVATIDTDSSLAKNDLSGIDKENFI